MDPDSPLVAPQDRMNVAPSSQRPCKDLSNFLKLKEEVVKHPQGYIRRRATAIYRTLGPDHEAVQCLSAFGDQAQKFAAEILAIIEWGTQHWKLQESFPVPVVPKWLRTLEFVQTMMPMCGELPIVPPGTHDKDIRVHCPEVWSWMAILLQFWQDHMTTHLFSGRFCQASHLANTLIWDINVWLPHCTRFGWKYVARHTSLVARHTRPICGGAPGRMGSPEAPGDGPQ